jgi:acyl-CoA thioesterase I
MAQDELTRLVQFAQPEKVLRTLPGAEAVSESLLATLLGTDLETYLSIRQSFLENVREAAEELLEDEALAAKVDHLPFRPGDKVIGFGDSLTADRQSWLEILRELLRLRRPDDGIEVVNLGISGDTTTQLIARFWEVVTLEPQWLVILVGTNDARRYGPSATKTLVSAEEVEKNLVLLHNLAKSRTQARLVWLTPAGILEERIAADPTSALLGVSRRQDDLDDIIDTVHKLPEPVIDLREVFDRPVRPELLLPDGLHPSLEGQQAIVKALVEHLKAL